MILFLHFHKCGGSTINKCFNHYIKYKPNVNGNPFLVDDEYNKKSIIKFWEYKPDKINTFFHNIIEDKIQFIACEWNWFKYSDIQHINFDKINLITCIRDPFERFISNYNANGGNTIFQTPEKYNNKILYWERSFTNQKFKLNTNKYNYYVKLLNGLGNKPNAKINKTHLDNAKNILCKFNTIIILEKPETFKLLQEYGIAEVVTRNKSNKPKPIITQDFKDQFIINNKYDYELYNFAANLSISKLKKLNY